MEDRDFKKTFFFREIRRVNICRLFVCIAALLIIFMLDTRKTVRLAAARFRGIAEISPSELAEIYDPEVQLENLGFGANIEKSDAFEADSNLRRLMYTSNGRCIVSFTPEEIISTDYIAMEASGKPSQTVEYVYARIGDRLLIVKRSIQVPLDTLTGTVGYLPSDILFAVTSAGAASPDEVLPLIMDTTLETFSHLKTDIALSAVILIIWSVFTVGVVRDLADYTRSAAYKRIFICHGSVEDNAFSIDDELKSAGSPSVFGTTVTETWSIKRRLFSFTVEPRSSYTDKDNSFDT